MGELGGVNQYQQLFEKTNIKCTHAKLAAILCIILALYHAVFTNFC